VRREIDHWFSPNLHKHMEIATYGHYGFPLLLFPTAAADYLEYERFHLIDSIAPYINAGKVKVFSINSINNESWLNKSVHPKWKGIRQQQYNAYITDEVVPFIWHKCQSRIGIVTCGASLGAYHCANQLFRRPDLFSGCIAMSGCYDIREYYESYGYHDENIYFNNIAEYLPSLYDDYYLPMLQHKSHIHILTGSGAYEQPDASRWLSHVLWSKGIPNECDVWGWDMRHDWPTWRDMLPYYLATRF
jgi:esterase/lipase superfamily enzyme